ncbi:hypothetical protein TEA_019281 [Camellia sinensis var. sinensis]|uniref:Major facilitator superfamily (MFS) profile domain-containing protein n=1 Tax=Camellia sinensis var. sinensis TaxID=542762 RepID=A0A4S4EFL6_CAMSN|nr:hypothetical protein TEA_019281 [Camellia sinensis var. sinensis]
MVGVAGVPALVQFILMLLLPESPRWLYRQNKVPETQAILEKIYPANEVEEEMKALQSSVEAEKVEEAAIGDGMFSKIKSAWKNDVVRRGLYAGITVQLHRDHSSSGSAICGYGRRRLVILLMIGIIVCLVALSVVFFQASDASSWSYTKCLKAASDSAFCANSPNKYLPGACLAASDATRDACRTEHRTWYTKGCPTKFGALAVLLLGLYIIMYSSGMETVPWIVNSEIYPLRYRGIRGGTAFSLYRRRKDCHLRKLRRCWKRGTGQAFAPSKKDVDPA